RNAPLEHPCSGNWRKESCEKNDENMPGIRGDERTGAIYLRAHMRIFNHYPLRATAQTTEDHPAPGPDAPRSANGARVHVAPDDGWAADYYVADSPRAKERLMFSGAKE